MTHPSAYAVSARDGLNNSLQSVLQALEFSPGGVLVLSWHKLTLFAFHWKRFCCLRSPRSVLGRIHPCPATNVWRTIHRFDSASSVLSCSVFFFKSR